MSQSRSGAGSAIDVSNDTLASSPGESSIVVTPKDVSPDSAGARDLTQRNLHSDNIDEREEALLDDAIELSFPASDPIAIPPSRELHGRPQTNKPHRAKPAAAPKP